MRAGSGGRHLHHGAPSRPKYTCLVGLGLTFFGGALTPALRAAVDELARLVVGDDPTQVEAIPARIRAKSRPAAWSNVSTPGVRVMVSHVPICTSPRSARTR